MSAPYPPDFRVARFTYRCTCGGLLRFVYRRLIGRRVVQEQSRCARCNKITECRPRGGKR